MCNMLIPLVQWASHSNLAHCRNLWMRAIKNSVQRPHACIWQQLRRDVTSQTSSRRLALFQPSCPFWWKRVDSLQQSKWLISLWKIVNFRWKRCLSDGASDGALIWVDFVRGRAEFAELSRLMCLCVLFPFWKERGWSWWHSRFECHFRWNDWDLVPERGSLACCVKFCFWVAGHEDCFPSSILTAKQRSQTKMWGYVRGQFCWCRILFLFSRWRSSARNCGPRTRRSWPSSSRSSRLSCSTCAWPRSPVELPPSCPRCESLALTSGTIRMLICFFQF